MTISAGDPVPTVRAGTVVQAAHVAQEEEETSTADLVLPLVAATAAVALAGYAFVRRTRRTRRTRRIQRTRTRTTPGGIPAVITPSPLAELDERARASLVEADDCVRTSREELGFVEARFGTAAVAPFARAVRDAEDELSAAFRMRQQYDDGVPAEGTSRRHALAGIVGRCQEAGRRLDAEAAGFGQLRGMEQGVSEALEIAETRFRELTGRTGAAQATLADLAQRYAHAATAAVTGYVEQAKDRLLFATSHLNESRQAADSGESGRAAPHLRAAEGAVAQAAVFLDDIDHLAQALAEAADIVPAALAGAEAEVAEARGRLTEADGRAGGASTPTDGSADAATGGGPGSPGSPARGGAGGADATALISGLPIDQAGGVPEMPVGELRARIRHADTVLAAVREELTGGPYDPLDALRRIVRAVVPVASGQTGVLPAAALLAARASVALADGFVVTHRRAVGSEARTRLAEAERLLAAGPAERAAAGLRAQAATAQRRAPAVGRMRASARTVTGDRATADTLARHARALAEQDVRVHGNPVAGAADYASGTGGAAMGGILLSGGSDSMPESVSAASFGGPGTRMRYNFPAP
ncbi:hypothetical protein [Streptomyces blattellae]|uniref:hypothetical protein n=1 Tax=Streptomyces blattellae TaxID=2569855 RepID=UPI001E643644|nr:hypothetical protein [Streptomyces blattellae]